MDQLWVRGGFRQSFLASSEIRSLRWRQDFIRSYLEQDIPQFAPRISTETLRRFFWGGCWHMAQRQVVEIQETWMTLTQ